MTHKLILQMAVWRSTSIGKELPINRHQSLNSRQQQASRRARTCGKLLHRIELPTWLESWGRKSSQWHEHLNDKEELKRSQFSQLSYVLFFRLRKSKQSLVVAVYAFSAPVQHLIPVLFFIRPSRLCPRLFFKRECHYAICRNATTQILLVSTCWRVSVPETIQLKHFTHFLLW